MENLEAGLAGQLDLFLKGAQPQERPSRDPSGRKPKNAKTRKKAIKVPKRNIMKAIRRRKLRVER